MNSKYNSHLLEGEAEHSDVLVCNSCLLSCKKRRCSSSSSKAAMGRTVDSVEHALNDTLHKALLLVVVDAHHL